jgi:predicted RNA-binding protein associated with RNAse of E/G family
VCSTSASTEDVYSIFEELTSGSEQDVRIIRKGIQRKWVYFIFISKFYKLLKQYNLYVDMMDTKK